MTLMRTAILIGALAFVTSCGSAKKKDETAAAPAPTATAAPTQSAPAAEMKAEKTKGEKKMTRPTKTVVADANAKEVKCTSGSDERLLTINPKDGGCELQYTKAGQMNVIATQISGDGRCVEVMGNVRKNLEGAQFTCQ